jgi:hypothetical protein
VAVSKKFWSPRVLWGEGGGGGVSVKIARHGSDCARSLPVKKIIKRRLGNLQKLASTPRRDL